MVGEPEVVLGAEQQDGTTVEHDSGALRPAHHSHPAVQAQVLELSEAVVYVEQWAGGGGGNGTSGPGRWLPGGYPGRTTMAEPPPRRVGSAAACWRPPGKKRMPSTAPISFGGPGVTR